ncbi:MAG: YhdP family protein [Betaproteobacteria bacterium]
MPFARASSSFPAGFSSSFRKVLRAAGAIALIVLVSFCLMLLAVRFVIFPRIENNPDAVAHALSAQIGQPVEIASLSTGWDGWNPRLDIGALRILEPGGDNPSVSLPDMRLTVAWDSLLFFQLRLKQLSIDAPRLLVSRDREGMLHIAGMTFNLAEKAGDQGVVDWVLRQPRIVIRDAVIGWRDDMRGAPQLTLEHVGLRLENRSGRHRFGLTGAPPANLAGPLDVRGDFTGGSPSDWRAASGRLYARLDYADVGAWREWLPPGLPISAGKGALRMWVEFGQGEAHDVVADLVLSDVQAKFASDLPQLSLTRLEGRVGWHDDPVRREIFAGQLAFSGPGELRLDPTDFKLTMRYGAGGPIDGNAAFNRIELVPLRQIGAYLPLPTRWRDDLARFAPRGTLDAVALHWTGDVAAPSAFDASANFADLGFAPQDAVPGVTGLSGSIAATERDGTIKLNSRVLAVHWPHLFAQTLSLDSAQGQLHWRKAADAYTVQVERLALANADAAGVVKGEYRTLADGPGAVDGSAQFSRLDAAQLYRYVPLAAGAGVREWLRTSLLAGGSNDALLKLKGNLADFPFADAKKGQFIATAKAQGLTLDYATHWPRLTGLDGDVRLDGPHISVDGRNGRAFNATISRVKVEIADVRIAHPLLRIDGEAAGPATDFLRFIAESPVDEWLDHTTRGAEASGDGKLALKLELPIGNHDGDQIAGDFTFAGNRLKFAGGIPALSQLNGKLAFSRREIRSTALTAEILGGPARLTVSGAVGGMRVDGQGNADVGLLRAEYPQQGLASRLTGSTDWQLALNVASDRSNWTLASTFKGVAVDLPIPAAKLPGEAMPVRIERHQTEAATDLLRFSYGGLGRLSVQRRLTPSGPVAERALLALGKAEGAPDRRGLWVRGDVDQLDLDAWLALRELIDAGVDTGPLPVSGIDVSVGALDVFSRRLNDLRIGASRSGSDWQLDLHGRELEGTARWESAAPAHPNGRIVARLQRLTPPTAAPAHPASAATTASDANGWPAIDLSAESLRLKERDLGRLELSAQPRGIDWRIDSLKLTNDDGRLEANGWWRGGGHAEQTTLDADLDVHDAGKYLARYALPDAVRGGATRIRGQVSWSGGPQDFDYPTLNGKLRIETGRGQFTKLDPGLGKLLGVLSLQSLKRRLTFDFQDLFGEGFAFDEITGDVRIQNGVMKSDDLKIVGPPARVTIKGETDIARETQHLSVHVQPTLSAGVSVGAAALLLANPVIGAAVYAGSLFAQKAMQDPIEQMFSYGYAVTGSWSDPIVEREGRFPGPAAAAAAKPDATRE